MDNQNIDKVKFSDVDSKKAFAAAARLVTEVEKVIIGKRREVMLTVTALAITEEPFAVQQSLFDDAPKTDPKREKLEKSLDAIRKKYGRGAIGAGSILHNDMGLGELTIRPQEDEEEEEFDEKVKGPL